MTNDIEKRHQVDIAQLSQGLSGIWRFLLAAGVLILVLIVVAAFVENWAAKVLTGILTALITTLVSVYATYHSASVASQKTSKDELTRYGLLAWRNLDSLQLKVSQQFAKSEADTKDLLREWLLDIDQAKWAWQDILREVFVLQQRLQVESFELAKEFREKMRTAQPEDRPKLEAEHQAHLAKLVSSSPLPLRIPTDVQCPNCGNSVTAQLGSNAGDTDTLRCAYCRRMFHVHRGGDGVPFTRRFGHRGISPVQEVGLRVVEAVFSAAPNEILAGGWEEFFDSVGRGIAKEGLLLSDLRFIKNFLFSRKAFRLLGPNNGIGLVVPANQLSEFIKKGLGLDGVESDSGEDTPSTADSSSGGWH